MIAALARISLTSILVGSAAIELLLNRIATHLVGRSTAAFPFVDRSGLLVLHFTSLLAALLAAWGLSVLVRDPRLLGALGRTAVAIAAVFFLPLATAGTLFRLSSTLTAHTSSAFGLLLISLVGAFLARPTALRHKLGVIYLAAPMLLHCYSFLTQQLPSLAPRGSYADLPSRLFEAGEQMVVVGAFASFLFFSPAQRWTRLLEPLPTAAAVFFTGFAAILLQTAFPIASQAAYYGLGLNLPSPLGSALHLSGLFFFVLTVGRLILRPGHARAMSFGLLLVAISGFQLRAAHQLLLTAIGVMLLVRAAIAATADSAAPTEPAGALASGPTPPSADDWRRFLERLDASDPSAAETVVLENVTAQIVRWRGTRDGVPLNLRIAVHRGQPEELEVSVGRVPANTPAVELIRRPRWRGRHAATDLPFTVRDHDEASSVLRAPELREGLERLIHGTLRIWPEEGVQYTARIAAANSPLPAQINSPGASSTQLRELLLLVHRVAAAFHVRG